MRLLYALAEKLNHVVDLTEILALPARPRSGDKRWRESLHRYHRIWFFGAFD